MNSSKDCQDADVQTHIFAIRGAGQKIFLNATRRLVITLKIEHNAWAMN